MSFKKRTTKNSNKRKREDNEKEKEEEEKEEQETEELVARTKLVQQARNRSKGLDVTSEGMSKKRKKEDDSDFASLKFGLNHFQPQVDLPDQLKKKMETFIEENLKKSNQTPEPKSEST